MSSCSRANPSEARRFPVKGHNLIVLHLQVSPTLYDRRQLYTIALAHPVQVVHHNTLVLHEEGRVKREMIPQNARKARAEPLDDVDVLAAALRGRVEEVRLKQGRLVELCFLGELAVVEA